MYYSIGTFIGFDRTRHIEHSKLCLDLYTSNTTMLHSAILQYLKYHTSLIVTKITTCVVVQAAVQANSHINGCGTLKHKISIF